MGNGGDDGLECLSNICVGVPATTTGDTATSGDPTATSGEATTGGGDGVDATTGVVEGSGGT